MNKILITAVAVLSLSLASLRAQDPVTNQIPDLIPAAVQVPLSFLSTPSTNWHVAAYGIVNTRNHDTGYGVAAYYKVTDYVGAFLRLDNLGGVLTMPSGNFQLQLPITVLGRFTAVPFAFTGVAFPIGRSEDKTVAGVLGTGFAIRVGADTAWYVPKDLLIDVEKWTNVDGLQLRAGVAWKF